MAGASSPYYLLKEEFIQRADEGVKIPPALRARYDGLDAGADEWNLAVIDPIYDELTALPCDEALAAKEPNELERIRELRPDGPRDLQWKPPDAELLDRLHGAWTGRCVGCALGKPVEGRALQRDENERLNGRRSIKEYLQKRDEWPLEDYFSMRDVGDGDTIPPFKSYRENITFMEPDDDIHYSLIGLDVLERHGFNFHWHDVARAWLSRLPIPAICCAEAQAILNVQNQSRRGMEIQADAHWTSTYRNPYREWIGSQIRADGWAFACAGKPELAAELAWLDACWVSRRNGIYGEMMFAAMQAAAFAERDVTRLVEIGLSEIPKECRLAGWIRKVLEWCRQYEDFETCMDRLEDELNEMHAVHVINNAMICVIALWYGKLNTTRSPSIAVMCGLDTDCNGATVGSIVGAAAGRKNFGEKLAGRLNDEVRPNMFGFERVKMQELAARSAKLWKQHQAP